MRITEEMYNDIKKKLETNDKIATHQLVTSLSEITNLFAKLDRKTECQK